MTQELSVRLLERRSVVPAVVKTIEDLEGSGGDTKGLGAGEVLAAQVIDDDSFAQPSTSDHSSFESGELESDSEDHGTADYGTSAASRQLFDQETLFDRQPCQPLPEVREIFKIERAVTKRAQHRTVRKSGQ